MSGAANSLSIYFFTGDFAEAYRRHCEGEEQDYATHDEIAKLINDLVERDVAVRIHSFVSAEAKTIAWSPKLEFVSLGGRRYDDSEVLRRAVAVDPSSAIIPHFPDHSMLSSVIRSGRRSMAVLASSYYRRSLKAPFNKWRLARLLNSSSFELVSNHCRPSSQHIADFGVDARKLVPWDIPHRYKPEDFEAKALRDAPSRRIAYAGSISEDKGVGDLIRAIAKLRQSQPVECSIAGSGDVEGMQALAAELGVESHVRFVGQVRNNAVLELFRDADLVVVPSRHEFPEGFPLTFFEAIASRTPILCSDHPIFCKVIEDRRNAVVFKANDPDSLASAAETCLGDASLYDALSANAPETWTKLGGTADWRTLIRTWFLEGPSSPWIQERVLKRA